MGAGAALSGPASVVVSEVFGPTFQGEGPSIGLRAAFVRLGGCNLHCSWCDTPYTWDAKRFDLRAELTRMSVADIVRRVADMNPRVIVVTGGEPLLWQARDGWAPLLGGLAALASVEVETNGTIIPRDADPVAQYNVSPKLAHAGDSHADRIRQEPLRRFAALAREGCATLKIVVKTTTHVRQAAHLARSMDWPMHRAYVMPEATTAAVLTRRHRELAQVALEEGINMTTRLHVLSWGKERAR